MIRCLRRVLRIELGRGGFDLRFIGRRLLADGARKSPAQLGPTVDASHHCCFWQRVHLASP